MSIYSNKIGVGIAEMGRLDFFEEVNGNTETVAKIVIPYEAFKNMYAVMGQTIMQFEEAMIKRVEANKGMN